MIHLEIFARIAHIGSTYKVVAEDVPGGCVRLVVERYDDNSDTPAESQGVDLTADECAVLGEHLAALAGRRRGA